MCGLAGLALRAEPARTQDLADPLSELRARVRSDDSDAALAQLDQLALAGSDTAALAYLRARLHERKQQLRAALAALPADLSTFPDEVANDVAKRRALWQASEGYCSQAQLALHSLDGPDGALSLRVAECALTHKDPAMALSVLKDLRGSARRSFAVRRALGQALEQTGDKAAASAELRSLYIDFPEHKAASEVLSQLKHLDKSFQLNQDERFARAQRWLDVAQPEAALEELSHLSIKPGRTPKDRQTQRAARARLLHLKGMALFRMRTRYAEAAIVLNQAAALGGTTQADDAFHAVQALARADRDREAVKAYYKFAKTYPKDQLASSALHNAAWLELRHDLPGGEAHMQAFLKRAERSRNKRALTEPLWQLAQYAFKHQRYKQSLPLFERYSTTADGPMVKARGLYWAGRCAQLSNQNPLALRYYRAAMAVEPLHWYALLSRTRIVALGADPGPPLPESITTHTPIPKQMEPVPLPAAAHFYSQLGLDEDAVGVLRAQESSWRRQGNTGLVQLLAAYHTLGEYARPYQLAARERQDTLLQPAGIEQRAVWTALYPRPYADDVSEAAAREQIAEELVYSIMRKESAYKPGVVSHADAIGLLQLIVPTGRANAAEIGIKPLERSMLFEPSINIRVGTHYLAKLVAHYKGAAPLAIAAYNAGEHKVDEWLKRASRQKNRVELDWFVEDIPFEQTRNYTRSVVTCWARYVFLEQPDKGWPLDLSLALPQ
ncbi:MAG TPA: transglycosylase SLT domain-containing protein [Polyangiales bacterium]|nr:transglycosylase SLT domain-containing protein [Polyangiales bacterium]